MESKAITEGTLLWEPSEALKSVANITKYMAWLKERKGLEFHDYDALWQWSVAKKEDFWESLYEFFEIIDSRTYDKVLDGEMPAAKWFPGSELNYVEHVFRRMTPDHPALLFQSEIDPLTEISWEELHGEGFFHGSLHAGSRCQEGRSCGIPSA